MDVEKAANLLLDDFRNGRLGRITLETPEEGGVSNGCLKNDFTGKEH